MLEFCLKQKENGEEPIKKQEVKLHGHSLEHIQPCPISKNPSSQDRLGAGQALLAFPAVTAPSYSTEHSKKEVISSRNLQQLQAQILWS